MGKLGPEGVVPIRRKTWTETDIINAENTGYIVEMEVDRCDPEMNLRIEMGENVYCTIPKEEVEVVSKCNQSSNYMSIMSRVGKAVKFRIISHRVDIHGNIFVTGSRRSVQQECIDTVISKLTPGDVISAKVSRVDRFGIFCDIGCGIIALMPVKNVSTNRIADPGSRLRGWKNLFAVVKSIDADGRIELTHKELLGTWEEQVANFRTGETVQGTISAIEDFGIFVDLDQNLSGLADVVDGAKVGDKVGVYIKEISPENMRIRLNIVSYEACKEHAGKKFIYKVKDKHISKWVYSPAGSKKVIETVFDKCN